MQRDITKVKENYTDLNYIKVLTINGLTVLIICIDSNQLSEDYGLVEEEVLRKISKKISRIKYDIPIMLIHHSILGTDEAPLKNSLTLTDFVWEHKIGHVFCGHTHQLDLRATTDLYLNHSFNQYMVGSLSSCNHKNDDNMFLFIKNFATAEMQVYVIRILLDGDSMSFNEELVMGVTSK